MSATMAVIELDKALKTGIGLQSKLERNRELDNEIKLLATKADEYLPQHPGTSLLDLEESVVADCLKLIGRIKVNRLVDTSFPLEGLEGIFADITL